jgi:tricorn protease-like protein
MSNDKEIMNKLFRVVAQQQQIITKLAQQNVGAVPQMDMRASVEADIYDILFGKGAKPQFGAKPQVHYAKIAPAAAGKVLVVGLTIPEEFSSKWQASQGMIEGALKNKYGVTAVSFKL